MQQAIEKADVLIEALQWIREFRDKITVIKLGGSVMEDPRALDHLLLDVVFMETVGLHPVLVHGGGAAISRAMTEAGLEPRFVQGRRYTDDAALAIVERVLGREVNEGLVARIEMLGGAAKPLNFGTTNVLYGERIALRDEAGRPVDLGHVGQVTRVDAAKIRSLCVGNVVPVIPSLCVSDDGQRLNVNADTAAMAVARQLGAEKLVFLSDVNGVRRRRDEPESLLHTLNSEQAQELIRSGAIESGMIPKIQACLETVAQGVRKVHIIDGRLRHSLLLEVYTSKGVGTEIVH
ncbi:MAG TPA: acetylglutamate kinase [Thermoguttaceae bacterium]|nr:acetylglutamate kinase [Thermoguttaceae bacterium]